MSFVRVTHESRPGREYRVPEHWLKHPTLSKGLSPAGKRSTRRQQGAEKPASEATTKEKE